MRAVFEFVQRGVQRVNAKIALLAVVVAAGGVAVWQGYAHMANSKPKAEGPTKKIAIGVDPSAATAAAAPAAAPLAAQPSSASGPYALMAYQPEAQTASAATSPPPTAPPINNPFVPGAADPPGGYGGGSYSAAAPPATSPPATSPPEAQSPATAPAESIPENIYRQGGAAASTAVANDTAAPVVNPATLNPAAEPAAGGSSRRSGGSYGAGASGGQLNDEPTTTQLATPSPATTAPPAEAYTAPAVLPQAAVPPNPLPAQAVENPYMPTRGLNDGLSARAQPIQSAAASKLAAPTPGERQLEGPQQPTIALEKVSPGEIQVGKQATFELFVKNTGRIPAQNVVVTDHVPAGTQLVDVRPQPQQGSDGSLVWSLGTLQPGEETQITLQVLPQTEGEIGSTAHVTFAAAATSRSICTRPQLTIEHTAPPKVLIGESFGVEITISNPGSGPATGVRIEEDVPAGLAHAAGGQLEYEVGTLRPGEAKRLQLVLTAKQAGAIQNVIHAKGDANLAAQHAIQLEVVAPQLTVDVDGPKRRPPGRQATYTVQIANPGTAAARDVEMAAFLPRGMKFVAADGQGQYDAAQHAVFWSLAELPPAKAGAVKLTAVPVEAGEQRLRVEGRAGLGLTAADEQVVQIEQSAELVLNVKDIDEVIEVGSETTYEIRVSNTGTKAATNVRISAALPAGMAAITGEGPSRAGGDASQITFEPLARLNPQEEVVYKVQVQGKQPGDHIVKVQLASDEWPTPVSREESTRVYLDR